MGRAVPQLHSTSFFFGGKVWCPLSYYPIFVDVGLSKVSTYYLKSETFVRPDRKIACWVLDAQLQTLICSSLNPI